MAILSLALKQLIFLASLHPVFALVLPTADILTNPNNSPLHLNITSPAVILSSPNESASAPAFSFPSKFLSPSTTALPHAVCNGDRFGYNLQLVSCRDALDGIIDSTVSASFGARGHGFDVQLPRRFSSADGVCVIDIFLKDGAVSDLSNGREISTAAKSVLFSCARLDKRYAGGYARDIGVFSNLVVVVSVYKPTVSCFGSTKPATNVGQELLDIIPYNYTYEHFGPEDREGIQVKVPKSFSLFAPPPFNFYALISVDNEDGKTATGRWWDLWTGAVAINAMCVRNSKAGAAVFEEGLRIKIDRRWS